MGVHKNVSLLNTFFLKFFLFFCIIMFAFYVSVNWYQVLLIHGESMSPTYQDMQIVILEKHLERYTYGDVIAFQCENLDSILVKRIVACPGDDVVIKNGHLYVNGTISVIFPQENVFEYAGIIETPLKLERNQYFVLGDNIAESKDSRYENIGCIEEENILGRVK